MTERKGTLLTTERQAFIAGIKACAAIAVAGALFGFVYGVLSHSKGLSTLESSLMSIFMFAGAAQMVAVSMWSFDHIHLFALISTCFIICLRFTLMGASLRLYFKNLPPWRVYASLFFLIDENWAITTMQGQRQNSPDSLIWWYYLGTSLAFYIAWIISSVVGNLLAEYISHPDRWGFDFAFTAIFLALLVGMWRTKRDALPWLCSLVVALLCADFIPGNWHIIIGALAGSLFGVWRDYR